MTPGIMVVSAAMNSKHSKDVIAAKDNESSKQHKNNKPTKSRSSISAHRVEQLDPTAVTRPASPSDLISKLAISSSQASNIPRTSLSSPTDSAFSPGPMSASIDMPSTPSAPCTPSTPHVDRYLSSSPEPISPTLPCAPPTNAVPSASSGSRFAAMFSKGYRSSEDSVRQQENGTEQDHMPMQQEPKKKRLSAGSMQAPISHFLTNTFRSNKQGLSSVLQQPQQQQQQQPVVEEGQQGQVQRKKRRSLLPKLPKLDTRPKIIISSPMRKGGRSDKKQREARATQGQDGQGSSTPGPLSSSTPVSGAGRGLGGAGHSFALALLSPFYLPAQLRHKDSSKSVQQAPPLFDSASLWDWRQHSRVYHDDRWDRASVLSADSDMARLSEDPNFPGYPERNEFWQKHCRIRERRLQKQQLQRQLSGMGHTAAADPDDSDDGERENDDVANLGPARMGPGGSRLRHTNSRNQSRHGKHRVRYTTYSAYMAAMQQKAKNRAERKNSDASLAPKLNAKLLEDMRLLQQRSMNQEANVKTIADRLQNGTNSVRPSMDLDGQLQQQQRLERRMNGTNLGSSDDDSDGQGRQHAGRPSMNLQRRRQQDDGILFVSSSATTAEVYPNLVHDPLGHLHDNGRATPNRMDYFRTAGQNTCTVGKDGFGDVVGIEDEKIGCLVASYFDKRLFEEGSESDGGGLPGAHSRRSSPSKACRNSGTVEDNEDGSANNRGSNNSRLNFDKEDLCLSLPGQYASHNHIVPLHRLLELQEQERQRKHIEIAHISYPQHHLRTTSNLIHSNTPATAAPLHLHPHSRSQSLPGTLSSHQPLIHDLLSTQSTFNSVCDSAPIASTGESSVSPNSPSLQQHVDLTGNPAAASYPPEHRSGGHMIVMLGQGQCRYYRNGTRERGPQWNDSELHENGVIDEEDEEEDEEGTGSTVHQFRDKGKQVQRSEEPIPISEGVHRQLCHFQELSQARDCESTERAGEDDNNVLPPPTLRSMSSVDANNISDPGSTSTSTGPLSSIQKPLADPVFFSGCASDPDTYSNSTTSLPPLPEPVSNSASRKSSLARIRGAKSRASVSYSVPPAITTLSFSSIATTTDSAPLSASTSTLPSTAPSTRPTSLRQRASGSMTPGSMTTGVTTPATPSTPLSSPKTLSWSDLSRYPTSASAMLLDALSKPMKTAYFLQHKDTEHRPSDQGREDLSSGSQKGSQLLRTSTGSTSSSFSTQSKRWMRKSIFRASSDGCVHPAGTAQHALQVSLQRRRPSRTWGYPGTTDEEEANEAEREMAQEIVLSESGTSGQSSRCQSPVNGGVGGFGSKSPHRKRSRTLSMAELSASTTASKYALSSAALTHQRYKAEALTSTTKGNMLRSEGEYEWNEFFDY
ncbi:hypothetical protein EC968_001361 [Mortierella alpina]|nr:hypothetical protein EC968_001361 [Mortierella alpina]